MDRIVITGGAKLNGSVTASGAKNASLPILASTILGTGDYVITNVPSVVDVVTMTKLLRILGASVTSDGHRVAVSVRGIASTEAPYELVKTMRASVVVLGPLLARWGEATVSLPGGCAIGTRPVNLHLAGLAKLGAEVSIEHGYIKAKVKGRRLKGARIALDVPTVTGTENLMMAACLADGTTVLENAAKEPEIGDLAAFLQKRGARISGAGTDVITIEGVRDLQGGEHDVIPDRIEAGTFLVAGAITGGDVCVERCEPRHLEALLTKLGEAGMEVSEEKERARVNASRRPAAIDVKTFPYPGFPTDMQAQFMALMAVAEGTSVITETVFEGRFTHVPELRRMGAPITVEGNHAVVTGTGALTGAPVMASDLRASAALILAGLAAEGDTEVSRVYHLDRGYERIEEKLRLLGASIRRIDGTTGRATAGAVA
jgi:UDP-N-acetylglucosamine 1-carboxyvinyltransferase